MKMALVATRRAGNGYRLAEFQPASMPLRPREVVGPILGLATPVARIGAPLLDYVDAGEAAHVHSGKPVRSRPLANSTARFGGRHR
jgi:hypothetical protein